MAAWSALLRSPLSLSLARALTHPYSGATSALTGSSLEARTTRREPRRPSAVGALMRAQSMAPGDSQKRLTVEVCGSVRQPGYSTGRKLSDRYELKTALSAAH